MSKASLVWIIDINKISQYHPSIKRINPIKSYFLIYSLLRNKDLVCPCAFWVTRSKNTYTNMCRKHQYKFSWILYSFITQQKHQKKRDGSAANQYLEATSVIIFATALGSQQIFLNFTTIQRKCQVLITSNLWV